MKSPEQSQNLQRQSRATKLSASDLKARLALHYQALQIIDRRRLQERDPNIGHGVEAQILQIHLSEIERLIDSSHCHGRLRPAAILVGVILGAAGLWVHSHTVGLVHGPVITQPL